MICWLFGHDYRPGSAECRACESGPLQPWEVWQLAAWLVVFIVCLAGLAFRAWR